MEIKRIIIGFGALLCTAGIANAQQITLEQVVNLAVENSTLSEQQAVLQKMGDNLSSALWHAYIPQLSLDGRWHYQNEVTKVSLEAPDKPLFEGADALGLPSLKDMMAEIQVPEIPKYQYQAYLQATQLIWDGGRVSAGAQQVQARTESQIAETKIDERKVRNAVTELYFSLLMLDKQAEMQDNLLAELDRQKQKVQKALTNGVASKNSLDEIAVEELSAQQQKTQIHQSRRAILDALEVYTDLRLDDTMEATVPTVPVMTIVSASDTRVAPERQEHVALDAQLKVADAEYRSFRTQLMPTIALFAQGGYGRPGLNMMNPEPRPFFMYGVRFNWNFGQLYNISSERKKRDYATELIALKRSAFERQVRADAAKNSNEVEQYKQLLVQDEKILSLRKEIRDRAELQVDEGTMTVYDQLQRMTSYQVAEQTKALHELQMLRAMYRQWMTME